MSSHYVKVATLSDFNKTGCITATANGHTLALFKYGENISAVDNRCPHMGFPLSKGTVRDGILTCYWHYARFDLATGGTFDQFADDVPAFPVEVRGEEVWVDLTPKSDRAAYYRQRLNDGLERDIPLVIAKAVINLLEPRPERQGSRGEGTDPVEPFKIGLEYGTRYRNQGWGQGLTILTCMMNLLPHLHAEDRARALYQGLSAVTRETTGNAPRFVVSPLPGDPENVATLKRWFRQFIEVRDDEGAERCVVSALRAGATPVQMADMLFAAATDHRYIQIGHPLDFTNKAFEALDWSGWEYAESVLTSLVRGYAFADRMEESNAWRHPVDLVAILERAFEQLPDIFAGGKTSGGTFEQEKLVGILLGDDPAGTVAAMLDVLERGTHPVELAQTVAYAASLRIARFHTSNEFTDWDTALHTFTFANAVHQGLRRIYAPQTSKVSEDYGSLYTELIRGIFDAAMSVYLDRFLNIPAARLPTPSTEPLRAGPNGNGATPRAVLDSFPGLLDQQQQVNPAGRAAADYLYAAGDPADLLATLGGLLLREDRDFHTIQTVEGAFHQYQLLGERPEAIHVLVAAARYLAAHAPTMRAQGQTYGIAVRLSRGENLFEE
ncbi:MAG TPA: Rieske (2Fe-2S) protein [Anaerolineales bacterium]|nr:Rieske (2Fe-2S) protein [Anaerolineales bacterium]